MSNEISRVIAANKDHIADNLNEFWRAWVHDLINGGVDASDVIESMISVAAAQGAIMAGTSGMAEALKSQAAFLQSLSDRGVEFPQFKDAQPPKVFKH